MTRDELEAVIWRAATYVGDEGTAGYLLGPAAVDAILTAADAYARRGKGRTLTPAEIADSAALRRARPSPVIHWQKPSGAPNTAACHGRPTSGHVTSQREAVSCGTCKQSRAWRTYDEAELP